MTHIIPQTELGPAELTEALLNHLARYRLTVFAALERLPEFSAAGLREIKNILRDCQRQSLVGSAPLHHGILLPGPSSGRLRNPGQVPRFQ